MSRSPATACRVRKPRWAPPVPLLVAVVVFAILAGAVAAPALAQPLNVVVVRQTSTTTNSPIVLCPAGRKAIGGGCSDDFTSTRLRSAFPLTSPPFVNEGFACVFEANPGSLTAYAFCLRDPGTLGLVRRRTTVTGTNSPFLSCGAGKQVIGGGCSDDFTSTRLRSTRPLTSPPFLSEGWACVFETNPGSLTAYTSCIDASVNINRSVVTNTTSGTNSPVALCPAGASILSGGCSDDFTSTRLRSAFPLTSPPFINEGYACVHETNPGSLSAIAICQQ